jgi:hypothetical protein
MRVKMVIFNDRKIPMNLQIHNDSQGKSSTTIEPATYEVVEIEIKEGCIPYFKIWETGQALLSFGTNVRLGNK